MTLFDAQFKAVHNDRIFRVVGHIHGRWFEDAVLDFVAQHQDDKCQIVKEDDSAVVVELI